MENILAIYIDIRKSSSFSGDEKVSLYQKFYNTFSKLKLEEFDNHEFKSKLYIGDGICLLIKGEINKDIYKIFKIIDDKIEEFISSSGVSGVGVGVSRDIFDDATVWNYELKTNIPQTVSQAIDYAAKASNIAFKYKIKNELRRWVLPLKYANGNYINSNDEIKQLIISEDCFSNESSSKKNLWFSF